ncbi:uncharacterized protein BHQ10_003387 [Talaromyces amestolkiae]|uniref:BTB domain-containing protein n=1 Tax=Talaromyces amestolkiae TaxID=1196081 RepID=A0A364KUZ1_TALAM|nr:uncharacterized protein BHQ10_003387 [Talaromyces amestolkiae]RAO67375.1 hypothetical protein BHQ10_003387 [Talaromyces amestolkiae]
MVVSELSSTEAALSELPALLRSFEVILSSGFGSNITNEESKIPVAVVVEGAFPESEFEQMSASTPVVEALLLQSVLPLYHGPSVKIRIKSSDYEYTVSKDLLCRESTYFSAMFEGGFKEGQQLQTILEDMEGVVSVQSLEAFLQWLYLRDINFDLDEPEYQISATIELARFADMCSVTGIETHIAQYLKRILVTNPNPYTVAYGEKINTYCVTTHHIILATFLPRGHAVRQILAAAAVERTLLCEDDKVFLETQEHPSFRADLLEEVRRTLKGLSFGLSVATYEDPLDGKEKKLYKFLGSRFRY